MCFAGIETEIRNLPERELPAPPKSSALPQDRGEPRTLRLTNAPASASPTPAPELKPASTLLPA